MTTSFYNRVKYNATSSGTGSFVTGTGITGFLTPATASVTDGATVSYTAESSDQSQWETGTGVYTSATHTLTRTVRESSNANALVNFSAAPIVRLDFLAQDVSSGGGVSIGDTIGGAAGWGFLFTDGFGKLTQDYINLGLVTSGGSFIYAFFGPTTFDGDGMWLGSLGIGGIGNWNKEGVGAGDGGTTIEFGSHGHMRVGRNLTAPSVSAGDSIAGTDLAGEVTIGVAHTGTTLTFGDTFTSAPYAVVTNQSGTAVTYSTTATAITISGANAGDKINYLVIGRQGAD